MTMQRLPTNASSSTTTGHGVGRLEHAPDADAAREVDALADLGARATVAQVSTMVPAPTQAPMFT